MYTGKLVFSQVMDYLPRHTFRRYVDRYQGEHYVKQFRRLDQYLVLAFAQLTYRESLRDIAVCLRAHQSKLYHMGIRSTSVARSTLSKANEKRDWRIYADFAQALIRIARPLYADEDLGLELDNTVYALDASTIDLCLLSFSLGAISLHQICCEATYFTGSSWEYPDLHPYFRRKAARRQRPRYPAAGGGGLLHDGPWLRGFRTAFHTAYGRRLLRYPGQVQYKIPSSLLTSGRQINRATMRSNHCVNRGQYSRRLSSAATPHQIPRPEEPSSLRSGLQSLSMCLLPSSENGSISIPISTQFYRF